MNIPKTLKIGYREYKVEWFAKATSEALEVFGRCSTDKGAITLCEGLHDDPRKLVNVLLHEVLHAVYDEMGLSSMKGPPTEEHVVATLANGLSQVLLDNPMLHKLLSFKEKKQ